MTTQARVHDALHQVMQYLEIDEYDRIKRGADAAEATMMDLMYHYSATTLNKSGPKRQKYYYDIDPSIYGCGDEFDCGLVRSFRMVSPFFRTGSSLIHLIRDIKQRQYHLCHRLVTVKSGIHQRHVTNDQIRLMFLDLLRASYSGNFKSILPPPDSDNDEPDYDALAEYHYETQYDLMSGR